MIGQWCEANIDIDLQNYCNCNGPNFHQHHIHKQKLHQPWTWQILTHLKLCRSQSPRHQEHGSFPFHNPSQICPVNPQSSVITSPWQSVKPLLFEVLPVAILNLMFIQTKPKYSGSHLKTKDIVIWIKIKKASLIKNQDIISILYGLNNPATWLSIYVRLALILILTSTMLVLILWNLLISGSFLY